MKNTQNTMKNKRVQSLIEGGFTLLEMLVVIAVVGVLAAIAVPRFQNSMQRATFVEVINAAAPYRTGVEMCLQRGNAVADCNAGNNGVPSAVGESTSKMVASVDVSSGVITATAGAGLNNVTYILTPKQAAAVTSGTTPSSSGITWVVSGTCQAEHLCD